MSHTLRGVAGGALALVVLQVVTANAAAAGKVGGLLDAAGGLAKRVLDPNVAAIPDRRGKTTAPGPAPAPPQPAPAAAAAPAVAYRSAPVPAGVAPADQTLTST